MLARRPGTILRLELWAMAGSEGCVAVASRSDHVQRNRCWMLGTCFTGTVSVDVNAGEASHQSSDIVAEKFGEHQRG